MCSSSGTPSSAAPWTTSSRLTPAGERLVLELLLDARRPRGPGGSATAGPGRRRRGSRTARPPRRGRGPSAYRGGRRCSAAWPRIARPLASGRPSAVRIRTPSAGCSSVGRVGGVGKALVVEVVQQADQAPGLGVLAGAGSAMARMAISTAYMCFRSASDAVYSCMRARARSRSRAIGDSGWGLRGLGVAGGERARGRRPRRRARSRRRTRRGGAAGRRTPAPRPPRRRPRRRAARRTGPCPRRRAARCRPRRRTGCGSRGCRSRCAARAPGAPGGCAGRRVGKFVSQTC